MIEKYWRPYFYGSSLMFLSYFVAYFAGWVKFEETNYLEVFAVWTSYVCTLMFAYQQRMAYPIGVITTAVYTVLFYNYELYAVALFNLYLVFSLAYGYVYWRSDNDPRPVQHEIKPVDWIIYPCVALIVYGILYLVNTYFNYEMMWADIVVAILSGVAQFGLDRKWKPNFVFWIIGNFICVWLYYKQGLYLVTLQYMAFIFTSGYSWFLWNKTRVSS